MTNVLSCRLNDLSRIVSCLLLRLDLNLNKDICDFAIEIMIGFKFQHHLQQHLVNILFLSDIGDDF